MHRHPSHTASSRQPRSRGFWLVAWCLVVFYIIASGRAFIPGICATQRAMDAQCNLSGDGISEGGRSCCAPPAARPADDESKSPRPVTPEESGCAFCKLVSALAPPSSTVALSLPPQPDFSSPAALMAQFTQAALPGDTQDRAPPA